MILFNIISGWVFIIYGIFKTIFCICDLLPSQSLPIKLSFLTHDRTVAGIVLVIIFLLFSIYTLLHGLALLNVLSNPIINILTNIYTNYIVYIIFSIVLIVFYSLVLFTNINISKNEKYISSYEIIGFGGGLSFLITVLILIIFKRIINKQYNLTTILIIICICILLLTFIMIIIKSYNKKNVNEQPIEYHIMSALAIPIVF